MTGTRLPRVVWVLAAGTFMLATSEFMIAGLLPETAAAMRVSVARAGLLITVFAVGMLRVWLALASAMLIMGGVIGTYTHITLLLTQVPA